MHGSERIYANFSWPAILLAQTLLKVSISPSRKARVLLGRKIAKPIKRLELFCLKCHSFSLIFLLSRVQAQSKEAEAEV
jgi:hypothetical protein